MSALPDRKNTSKRFQTSFTVSIGIQSTLMTLVCPLIQLMVSTCKHTAALSLERTRRVSFISQDLDPSDHKTTAPTSGPPSTPIYVHLNQVEEQGLSLSLPLVCFELYTINTRPSVTNTKSPVLRHQPVKLS